MIDPRPRCGGGQDATAQRPGSGRRGRRDQRRSSCTGRRHRSRPQSPLADRHRAAASSASQQGHQPRRPQAGQMSVERLHQDRTFVGSAGPRARTAPTTPPTHSPSDTEAASATTCQLTGITTREPSAATMTTAQAVMVTPPAARARCCASRVRHSPRTPNRPRPERASQSARRVPQCHRIRSQDEDPGHRNRRRDEQGSAEACEHDHLRADLIQHLGYRGLPPRPQSRAGERRLGAAEQPGLRTGGDRSRWPT